MFLSKTSLPLHCHINVYQQTIGEMFGGGEVTSNRLPCHTGGGELTNTSAANHIVTSTTDLQSLLFCTHTGVTKTTFCKISYGLVYVVISHKCYLVLQKAAA